VFPVAIGVYADSLARSSIVAMVLYAMMLRRFEAQHRHETPQTRAKFFSRSNRSHFVVDVNFDAGEQYQLLLTYGFAFAVELLPGVGTAPSVLEPWFVRHIRGNTFDCTKEELASRPVEWLEEGARELGWPLNAVGINSIRRYCLWRILNSETVVDAQRSGARYLSHKDGSNGHVNGTYHPGLENDGLSPHMRNVLHRVIFHVLSGGSSFRSTSIKNVGAPDVPTRASQRSARKSRPVPSELQK
jgi:hypothetical protein